MVLADSLGYFDFGLPAGKYLLEVKSMGYKVIYSQPFESKGLSSIDLGSMVLQVAATQLGTVTIDAKLPFVESRADKVIVNLNGLGSGAPIMEVMNQFRGSPLMHWTGSL